jgi:hypothetical protein
MAMKRASCWILPALAMLAMIVPAPVRGQAGFPDPDGVGGVQTRPVVEPVQEKKRLVVLTGIEADAGRCLGRSGKLKRRFGLDSE